MEGPGHPVARGAGQYKLLAAVETQKDKSNRLRLTLRLLNESHEAVYIVERVPSRDFNLDIRDSSGKTMSLRRGRLQGLIVDEGKQSLVRVESGQDVSYGIALDKLYSLVRGNYTLRATKVVLFGDNLTPLKVQSAPVRFAVKTSPKT